MLFQTLSLLFFDVLLTFYSHDITFPLFLLIHLLHDPAFCLLTALTLLIAFVPLTVWITHSFSHTDSIVV